MSKTAEEVLHESLVKNKDIQPDEPLENEIDADALRTLIEAMNDYAYQKVREYRDKLIDELADGQLYSRWDLLKIIDKL